MTAKSKPDPDKHVAKKPKIEQGPADVVKVIKRRKLVTKAQLPPPPPPPPPPPVPLKRAKSECSDSTLDFSSPSPGAGKTPPFGEASICPDTGLWGPAWYIDHVARGSTPEEARRRITSRAIWGAEAGLDAKSKRSPDEVVYRRQAIQVNQEAMRAVAQLDGSVDPIDVVGFFIHRTGLDKPACARPFKPIEADLFVQNMSRQSMDPQALLRAIAAEKEMEAANEARRRAKRYKSMPRELKAQIRAARRRQRELACAENDTGEPTTKAPLDDNA